MSKAEHYLKAVKDTAPEMIPKAKGAKPTRHFAQGGEVCMSCGGEVGPDGYARGGMVDDEDEDEARYGEDGRQDEDEATDPGMKTKRALLASLTKGR